MVFFKWTKTINLNIHLKIEILLLQCETNFAPANKISYDRAYAEIASGIGVIDVSQSVHWRVETSNNEIAFYIYIFYRTFAIELINLDIYSFKGSCQFSYKYING